MTIEVLPYDPAWPRRFAAVRDELERALRGVPVRAIEHVGSTAVPGLVAKPVIDVDVVVHRENVHDAIAALMAAGYEHRGERGIRDRHAMHAAADGASRSNVYVVVDGSVAHRNHLAVRDALRADPVLREAYGERKRHLANEAGDAWVYVEGKTDLLIDILASAGFTEDELDAIRAANRAPG